MGLVFISPQAEADLKIERTGPLTTNEKLLLRQIKDEWLLGDTDFEKSNLEPYMQAAYRRSIAEYLRQRSAREGGIGASLMARADELFASKGGSGIIHYNPEKPKPASYAAVALIFAATAAAAYVIWSEV